MSTGVVERADNKSTVYEDQDKAIQRKKNTKRKWKGKTEQNHQSEIKLFPLDCGGVNKDMRNENNVCSKEKKLII